MHLDAGVTEVLENQRYWGVTWGVPLLPFDWPAWSDAHGSTTSMIRPPEREGERGWFIVRTPGTDDEGWRYGTVFSKITTPRPGGRSSKRSSDYVRTRVWRKLMADRELVAVGASGGAAAAAADGQPPRGAPAGAGAGARPGPAAAATLPPDAERILLSAVAAAGVSGGAGAGAGAGGGIPKPSLYRLWQIFMELWNDACKRHGMRRLVPLDPLGLYVAARRHKDLHARLRAAQLAGGGRLVAKALYSAEPEPDLLDSPAAAEASAAASAAALEAGARGGSREEVMAAAVEASGASASAAAANHRSPAVGETPTGAPITQPAPPTASQQRPGPAGQQAAGPAAAGAEAATDCGSAAAMPSAAIAMSDPSALLDELEVAINYSRAAYGYAMAAGHLSSIPKLLAMFGGAAAHFNPVTGASVEANNEAIYLFTGIPVEDIVMAEWRSSVFRPCHYVAVDRARRRLVLVVRGSLELSDIATDLTARPIEFDFGGGLQGHVHQGLMSAATYVHLNTAQALRTAAERFAGWPLLVTGHSLGAGVAALLLLLLRQPGATAAPPQVPIVQCLSIAPPSVMSANLADQVVGCCVSIVHNTDFVARLSCYSVDRALLELVQASPAAQMADNLLQSTNATFAAIAQRFAAVSALAGRMTNSGEQQDLSRAGSSSREVEMAVTAPSPWRMEPPPAGDGSHGRLAAPPTAMLAGRPPPLHPPHQQQGLKDVVSLAEASQHSHGHGHQHGRIGRRSPHGHGHHAGQLPPSPALPGGVAGAARHASGPGGQEEGDDAHFEDMEDAASSTVTVPSYYSAGSMSYRSAGSSPSSRVGFPLEDGSDGAVLYRSQHPVHLPALGAGLGAWGGAGEGLQGGAAASSPWLQGGPRLPSHTAPRAVAVRPAGALHGGQYAAMTPPVLSPTDEPSPILAAATAAAAAAAPPPHASAAAAAATAAAAAAAAAAATAAAEARQASAAAAAAGEAAWDLGLSALFGGNDSSGTDSPPGGEGPLGLRRSSDPLANRGPLHQRHRSGGAGLGNAAGGRGGRHGHGGGPGGATGGAPAAWEALSSRLMTSWFGEGILDDDEGEEEEEVAQGGRRGHGHGRDQQAQRRSGSHGNWGGPLEGSGSGLGGGADSPEHEPWGTPQAHQSWLLGTSPPHHHPQQPPAHRSVEGADGARAQAQAAGRGPLAAPPPPQPLSPPAPLSAAQGLTSHPLSAAPPRHPHEQDRQRQEQEQRHQAPQRQQQQQQPQGTAAAAAATAKAQRHRHARSLPANDELFAHVAAAGDLSAVQLLDRAQAAQLAQDREDAAAAAAAGSPPQHLHALHKELYPPGRLLWIVYDEDGAAGPSLDGLVDTTAGGASGAAGQGQRGGLAAAGGPGGTMQPQGAAAGISSPALLGSAPGAAAGPGPRSARSSSTGSSPRSSASEAMAVGAADVGTPPSAGYASLLDMSLVTDLCQSLVPGLPPVPPSAPLPPPRASKKSRREHHQGAQEAQRPLGADTSSSSAAGAGDASGRVPAAAAADVRNGWPAAGAGAGAGSSSMGGQPQSGHKRSSPPATTPAAQGAAVPGLAPAVHAGSGSDALMAAAMQQQQRAAALSAPAFSASLAAEVGVADGSRARSANSSDDGSGGAGGGTADGSGGVAGTDGSAAAFSLQRMREGLKRIKSGVETLLRQAPLPQVPSMPPLFMGADDGDDDAQGLGLQGDGQAAQPGGGRGAGASPCVYLVEVTDRTVFERMVLIPTCATDHLPDGYFQALKKLSKGVVLPANE